MPTPTDPATTALHLRIDGPPPNPRCALCATSWPPARTMPRVELGTFTAAVVLGTAAGVALGYALGWREL
ncbi:hypothetical protein AB0C34_17295 [Nocardia sp. NPDC049220]|uniref:hypothetical protein n=1 Tax=Nocardia sp. NPDC049220 TaxID=3155273 RepID=UPI0033FFFDAB